MLLKGHSFSFSAVCTFQWFVRLTDRWLNFCEKKMTYLINKTCFRLRSIKKKGKPQILEVNVHEIVVHEKNMKMTV